jgi:hypothetical protein
MATTQCTTPGADMTDISRADGNDLSAMFTMRYRKASDPDVDASYLPVTTTKTLFGMFHTMSGITFPFFDITTVAPDTYVVHTYQTSSGSGTGTKITVEVTCDDEVGGG